MSNTIMLLDIAPEMENIDAGKLDRFLRMAKSQIDPESFSSDYDLAVCYLAAHMLTIANRRGRRDVTAESMGEVSRSYAAAPAGSFSQTPYGVEFQRLLSQSISVPTALWGGSGPWL